VLLVPVWLATAEGIRTDVLEGRSHPTTWLVVIIIVLGLSDVVDGWLARRYALTSRLGATLDAVADKLAQVAFVTYFAWRAAPAFPALPLWFWCLILGRDIVLAIGYLVLRRRQGTVDTEHERHGKIASVLLFLVILGVCAHAPSEAITAGVILTAIVVAYSTLAYVRAGFRALDASD
jgi:phosphatidylglycerophosphate synthase